MEEAKIATEHIADSNIETYSACASDTQLDSKIVKITATNLSALELASQAEEADHEKSTNETATKSTKNDVVANQQTELPTTTTTTPTTPLMANAENSNSKPQIALGVESPKKCDAVSETKLTTVQNETNDDSAYASHVTYNKDGRAIYTDPNTNHKYKWSNEQNKWLPCDGSATTALQNNYTTTNPYENDHYKWCNDTLQWLPKAQITETEHYKWCAVKNEWIAKTTAPTNAADATSTAAATVTERKYDVDADGQRIYTDTDGTVFFWDVKKKAWFPKIDDDFMAQYQMNYGFIDNTSASEQEQLKKEEEEVKRKAEELARMAEEARAATEEAALTSAGVVGKRKAQQEPPKWFELDPERNTKVYVSNLPLDITIDEFAELMGKCGMIMRDPQTQKQKLKLYTEADGQLKGDGLCDYIKVESVDLALKILDEYNLRGNKIHVQHAKFQMRGEYNPALKPKRKKKDKEKLLKMKEKLFDWRPEKMRGERSKNEKIVIIKNLFQPEIFEKEVQLILEYQNDLREECVKCGVVRKVVVYDRHDEGVAQINMATPEEADQVIQMMHGRFFGKRQLTAEHWDGKTKYKINETETEVQKRLSNWDQYLETEVDKKEKIVNAPEEACDSAAKEVLGDNQTQE